MFRHTFVMAVGIATSMIAVAGTPSIDLGKIHPQGLTRSQARQVLVFVLTREGYRLKRRGVFIEDLTGDDGRLSPPGHVSFGLSYDTPNCDPHQRRLNKILTQKRQPRLPFSLWRVSRRAPA
ncbi:hypothetical protein F2P45_33055 [Massilia sp. CCM 8733]|uniref:Uncharacterized protein n=1 Tax=Massilia mucilaginosa TaxID=2609282 RepID=A0ABX0P3X4_9BURK|nr:hypothetical protein [Massilia mucilaginosa]NHZ93794.1 hypothetical protein [Massilia mucilaginosa]